MIWKPNATVAAVIFRDDRYLVVEENTTDGVRFNQPAGHLEKGESLLVAVAREVLEETGYRFQATHLIGIYLWPHPGGEISYLRFAFGGELLGYDPERPLDDGIIAAHWLAFDELRVSAARHRSPLVMHCIEDARAGKSYPLDILAHYS